MVDKVKILLLGENVRIIWSAIVVFIAIALITVACKSNISLQSSEQDSSSDEGLSEDIAAQSSLLTDMTFPPDYSFAETIRIIIKSGTADGYSFDIHRLDDTQKWIRSELPGISDDVNQNPNSLLQSEQTYQPNEYLFDALIDAMFSEKAYEPIEQDYTDQEVRYRIFIYDADGIEIFFFDLFYYMNCIRYNDFCFSVAPEIDHAPFQVGYRLSRE